MPAIKTNGLTLYSDPIHAYTEDQAANARYKVFFSVKAEGPPLLLATKRAPPETFFTNAS